MHRTLRSLRVIFPGIVACFLVVSGLLALSSLKSTDIQIQDTAVVEVASGQPGLAYEIALYSRQLIDAKTDEDRADRTKAIQDGLARFERNQAALRNGDPSLDLPPLQHKEIMGTLDSVDSLWSDYRKLVTQLFTADLNDEKDFEAFSDKISDQAAAVSARADRVAKAFQVVAEQNQRASQLVFVVIVVVSVLAALGALAALIIVLHSLAALASATRQFAEGTYEARASTSGVTELADLGVAFNNMAATVQERDTQLKDFNKTLEQRVEERTEDLREARDEAVAATKIAQESVRLKSEFLSTMSHELRTPMNAIEGFTSIMLSKMGGVDYNDSTEVYLSRVNVNSKRLLQLINDFLDLSRVEAGRLELVTEPFSPKAATQHWYEEIGILAENKGLQFEMICDPDLPEKLYGDEESISKVALNLLSNAIKFTDEGKVTLASQTVDETWTITVSDTGIGISPHARDFIFEEFRQVDQSSKRKYGGSGLGLAIVQKYLRNMGGTVSITSELGRGSVFTVTLPLKTTA